jgi:hypothetical protein
MNTFSTPYENVLSLLGTSEAWKKYFPTLNPRGLQVEDIQPAYKETGSSKTPEFKGIDFSTGKTVDLGKFWGGQDLDVSSFWNPQSGEPSSNQINPPAYSTDASPLSVEDIKDIIKFQRGETSKTRAEEAAYNIGMMVPLQKAVTDTALLMRQADLQNRLAAETARQNLPESYAQRSGIFQQGRGLASGAFATELGAVSDAASRARQDVAAAIAAGKGYGRA